MGLTAMSQGIDSPSTSGYHVMTMRTIISNDESDSTGRKIKLRVPAVAESKAASSYTACVVVVAVSTKEAGSSALVRWNRFDRLKWLEFLFSRKAGVMRAGRRDKLVFDILPIIK